MNKLAKILIVEDDEMFRSTLADALLKRSFEVVEACDGQQAKELIALYSFDLVLSDIHMPKLTGVELLEWTRSRYKIPFVLMTGSYESLEIEAARDLGADDLIAKPFPIDQMIDILQKHTHKTAKIVARPSSDDLDRKFCKVAIADFVSEKETECSLYLRIASDKYIRIAHKGGKISESRIRAYAEKGIDSVYLEATDFSRLVGYNLRVEKIVAANPSIDAAKRLRFMKHTSDLLVERAFVQGVDQKSYRETAEYLTTCIGMICEERQTSEMLELLSKHDDFLYSHSLGVSIISVMIGRSLGWTSHATLFRLAIGGLLHDVGKKEIPRALLEKPRFQLTQDERRIYESHPTRGRDILAAMDTMPSDILQIVYEHHEAQTGEGYPRGLSGRDIHPLAKVVSAADLFCDRALRSGPQSDTMTANGALRHLSKFCSDSIDPDIFAALRRLFNEASKVKENRAAS